MVLVAGAATTWLVASVVGPGIFHDHLRRAGVGHTSAEARHVEEAFTSALLIALGVALVAALLMTFAVSAYFTRRVHRSTTAVTLAASRIAEGHFEARIPSPAMGMEFEVLADTVNALAQRLSDIDRTRRQILADLAHEMRTPLAAIEAHLEAVEDGVRELDTETLGVLHGATQRLHRLAEDIGTVSRAQEGQIDLRATRTSPATLLASAAAAAEEAYAGRGVTLVVGASDAPDVVADPERLGQVLGNLLENALRHTPGRREGRAGRSTVKARMGRDVGAGQRGRHRRRAPGAHLRALLPGGPRPPPRARGERDRPDHQPSTGGGPRWTAHGPQCRRGSGSHLRDRAAGGAAPRTARALRWGRWPRGVRPGVLERSHPRRNRAACRKSWVKTGAPRSSTVGSAPAVTSSRSPKTSTSSSTE